MNATYRFADRVVRIASDNQVLHRKCEGYRADGPPDFSVHVNKADLAFERERAARDDKAKGHEPRLRSDTSMELLAVYRQIAEQMPAYDTILFHGSAVAVDGIGYVFAAQSGTGKSTHSGLWRELFGERAVMVNDDKPLIHVAPDGATVYGTPWSGKHRLNSNVSVPLKAICILERADANQIARIDSLEALPYMLRQCYCPQDSGALVKTMSLIDRLMGTVELYRMGCTMDIEAARMAYEAMRPSPVGR